MISELPWSRQAVGGGGEHESVELQVRGDPRVFECLAGRHATDGPEDRNRSGDDFVDSGGHRAALVQ